jgi:hypothetical protein
MGQGEGVGEDEDEGVRPQASTAVSPVSIAEAIKTFGADVILRYSSLKLGYFERYSMT